MNKKNVKKKKSNANKRAHSVKKSTHSVKREKKKIKAQKGINREHERVSELITEFPDLEEYIEPIVTVDEVTTTLEIQEEQKKIIADVIAEVEHSQSLDSNEDPTETSEEITVDVSNDDNSISSDTQSDIDTETSAESSVDQSMDVSTVKEEIIDSNLLDTQSDIDSESSADTSVDQSIETLISKEEIIETASTVSPLDEIKDTPTSSPEGPITETPTQLRISPSEETSTQINQASLDPDATIGDEQAAEPIIPIKRGFRRAHQKGKITKLIDTLLRPFVPNLPVKSMLLRDERQVDSVHLIYFEEGQLLVGVLIGFISIISLFFDIPLFYSLVLLAIGLLVFFTGSVSEEIYLTNQRLLVRRIDLLERIFRVPRDEQYLISQVVSFQVGRAPFNRPLLYLLVFMTIVDAFLPVYLLFKIIVFLSLLPAIFFALRIGKRAFVFNLSGGHIVTLGAQKGLRLDFIDNFSEILLDINAIPLTGSIEIKP
ncbi:MAG: hypothetical protein INQ03_19405 [Candidatus Heimdallarchaeota archaeon]|nr:hypothetical protein [Candidatus Heimdallarchaeota archaeon]